MNGATTATKSYNEDVGPSYNPFRKFRRRAKGSFAYDDDGGRSQLPPSQNPSSSSLPYEITPTTQGDLFSSSEIQIEPTVNYESLSSRPVIGSSGIDQPVRRILDQKTSVSVIEAGVSSSSSKSSFTFRLWHRLRLGGLLAQAHPHPDIKVPLNLSRKRHLPVRKRKVLVVEYGKTDQVSDISAGTVRRSWDDPHYSAMEVEGYPVSDASIRPFRESSSLARPLGNALHKLMPQKGTANLRVFFIQDDREAFLCLGHAFHMTFFGHRTNFRAWAVGPSKASEELGKHQWMEYWAEHLYETQTAFWRPIRSGHFIRTAFGLEYPVVRLYDRHDLGKTEAYAEGLKGQLEDVHPIPEICGQRLSVYIQMKSNRMQDAFDMAPDLGLGENTIIILDTMHQGVTTEELSKAISVTVIVPVVRGHSFL